MKKVYYLLVLYTALFTGCLYKSVEKEGGLNTNQYVESTIQYEYAGNRAYMARLSFSIKIEKEITKIFSTGIMAVKIEKVRVGNLHQKLSHDSNIILEDTRIFTDIEIADSEKEYQIVFFRRKQKDGDGWSLFTSEALLNGTPGCYIFDKNARDVYIEFYINTPGNVRLGPYFTKVNKL